MSTAVEFVKVMGGNLHVVNAYKPDPVRADRLPGEFSNTQSEPADLLLSDLRLAVESGGSMPSTTRPRVTRPRPSSALPTASTPTSSWWATRA